MTNLPDAPWIREAELFGMPDAPDVWCPICNEENPEDFYVDDSGEIVGCSCCLHRRDSSYFYDVCGRNPYE